MEKKYQIGQKIRINHLKNEDSRYDGKEGFITLIDSIGQLHGTWRGLAVIPEEDDFVILAPQKYRISVTEVCHGYVTVLAYSKEEAIEKAHCLGDDYFVHKSDVTVDEKNLETINP